MVKDKNVTGTYTSKQKGIVWGYDVMLHKPVSLQPGEELTIIATINGPKSHTGRNGKSSVKVDDIVVTFDNAAHGLSTNSTRKNCGQFYQSFLSKLCR
jgi:hypothetical protein